jgi:hypothetical protein
VFLRISEGLACRRNGVRGHLFDGVVVSSSRIWESGEEHVSGGRGVVKDVTRER